MDFFVAKKKFFLLPTVIQVDIVLQNRENHLKKINFGYFSSIFCWYTRLIKKYFHVESRWNFYLNVSTHNTNSDTVYFDFFKYRPSVGRRIDIEQDSKWKTEEIYSWCNGKRLIYAVNNVVSYEQQSDDNAILLPILFSWNS
jgi:hypothetical protein